MNNLVVKAVNDQIQAEMESAYSYLAMSLECNDKSLPGTADWLRKQYEEEMTHAMKLIEHVHSRGGSVTLQDIKIHKYTFNGMLNLFKDVLSHEKDITSKIHRLYELALAEKDYPLQMVLHWFINEQVEEEESCNAIIDRITMSGETGATLLLLDRSLGERN